MTNIELPEGITEWKAFRRIIEMITDYVDDEVANLTDLILASADAPAPPDPDDNEAYDTYHDEYRAPLDTKIWDLIADHLKS